MLLCYWSCCAPVLECLKDGLWDEKEEVCVTGSRVVVIEDAVADQLEGAKR